MNMNETEAEMIARLMKEYKEAEPWRNLAFAIVFFGVMVVCMLLVTIRG